MSNDHPPKDRLSTLPPFGKPPASDSTPCDLSSPLSRQEYQLVRLGQITDLEARLDRCPILRDALIWQTGRGKSSHFASWSPAHKRRLDEIFQKLMRGDGDLGLQYPSSQSISPNSHRAYFTAAQAFDSFAAHAAHALYVEARRLVPWSLVNRPPAELAVFFSSKSYHSPIGASQNQDYPAGIQPGRDFKEAPENDGLGELNGDPRVGFRFLTGATSAAQQNLIGPDELTTLANLTVWLRDNVGHGQGDLSDSHRWLEDRLRAAPGSPLALANRGCHSASKLMVDLARSLNLPLLHGRAQESDATDSHFFNRTHGALVYGWGGRQPRILWHTDDIYANTGEPCFPIDKRGTLLPPDQAVRQYFEQRWRTPAQLTEAGFMYRLQTVYPEQGFGVTSCGAYEDCRDYGTMTGYWQKNGTSNLPELMRLEQHYELGGQFLLNLYCANILPPRITSDISAWHGSFPPDQLPPTHTIAEYQTRAAACVQALGGCSRYSQTYAAWYSSRGANLMV